MTTISKTNLLYDQLNTARNTWSRYLGDLARTWWVILVCAVGISVATGFIFVNFLKYFTGCMVWTIIFLTLGLLSFLTAYFYYKAGLISVPSYISSAVKTVTASISSTTSTVSSLSSVSLSGTGAGSSYAIIAYVSTALTIILLCVTIAVASSLVQAIEVIKLGTDALQATPSLIFFPCSNILALGLFGMWWVFIAAELASGGSAITLSGVVSDMKAGIAALNTTGSVSTAAANALLAGASVNNTMSAWATQDMTYYLLIYRAFE